MTIGTVTAVCASRFSKSLWTTVVLQLENVKVTRPVASIFGMNCTSVDLDRTSCIEHQYSNGSKRTIYHGHVLNDHRINKWSMFCYEIYLSWNVFPKTQVDVFVTLDLAYGSPYTEDANFM